MATKMCFIADDKKIFEEKIITFEYIKGMAFSQKQKNVLSFHSSIKKQYPNLKILEVSTKSQHSLGIALSAFNLKLDGFPIESIFQSSKVFADGSQFSELINASPKEAKQFIAHSNNGNIISFRYKDVSFPIEPKSLFYDYLYIMALRQTEHLSKQLIEFDIFTDIEFNEKKQFNCQARSCAIYSTLLRQGKLDFYLSSVENFAKLYNTDPVQTTLWDI